MDWHQKAEEIRKKRDEQEARRRQEASERSEKLRKTAGKIFGLPGEIGEAIEGFGEDIRESIHEAMFKCHVCGKPSSGPGTKQKGAGYYVYPSVMDDWAGNFRSHGEEVTYPVADWFEPIDLTKCDKCHRWTCNEHLYAGICQSCAK